eukprot:1159074-Pelagomonas_calceolata.AAC.5
MPQPVRYKASQHCRSATVVCVCVCVSKRAAAYGQQSLLMSELVYFKASQYCSDYCCVQNNVVFSIECLEP